ncbi:protein of unknown function [Paraburkholderia kururiensis]
MRRLLDRLALRAGRACKRCAVRVAIARHGHHVGSHLLTGPHALRAVHHDALALLEAARNDAQVALLAAQLHFAVRDVIGAVHDEDELLVLVGADRGVVDKQRRVRRAATHLDARVEARQQRAVCVVETRAHADRARRRIEPVIHGLDRARARVARFVGEAEIHRHLRAVLHVADVVEIRLLVCIERRVDGRHRNERGQRSRIGAGRHHVAQRDFRARHATGHRRHDARVAQIDLRRFQRGLRGLQVRTRLARGVLLLVVVALRDGVVRDKTLCAFPVALRIAGSRLGRGELRGGAIHFSLIRTRVDHEQRVAFFDERAVLEVDRHDGARHLRANVHLLDGFEPAGVRLPVDDAAFQHIGYVDFGRHGRLRLGRRIGIHAHGADRAESGNDHKGNHCNDDSGARQRKDRHSGLQCDGRFNSYSVGRSRAFVQRAVLLRRRVRCLRERA